MQYLSTNFEQDVYDSNPDVFALLGSLFQGLLNRGLYVLDQCINNRHWPTVYIHESAILSTTEDNSFASLSNQGIHNLPELDSCRFQENPSRHLLDGYLLDDFLLFRGRDDAQDVMLLLQTAAKEIIIHGMIVSKQTHGFEAMTFDLL